MYIVWVEYDIPSGRIVDAGSTKFDGSAWGGWDYKIEDDFREYARSRGWTKRADNRVYRSPVTDTAITRIGVCADSDGATNLADVYRQVGKFLPMPVA